MVCNMVTSPDYKMYDKIHNNSVHALEIQFTVSIYVLTGQSLIQIAVLLKGNNGKKYIQNIIKL